MNIKLIECSWGELLTVYEILLFYSTIGIMLINVMAISQLI